MFYEVFKFQILSRESIGYKLQGFPGSFRHGGTSAGGQSVNGGDEGGHRHHEGGHRHHGGNLILIDYIIN